MTIDISEESEPIRAASHAPDPPGPRGLPAIGCLSSFLRDPMRFLTRGAQRYGGLARIPLRGNYLYLASEPEVVRELLLTHRYRYRKNIRYRHVQALLGQGLLLSEGDVWRRQRHNTQPAFKAGPVEAQVGWMVEVTGAFLDRWRPLAECRATIDVQPDFNELAQRLAGEALLGDGFAEIADRFCAIASRVKRAWPVAPRTLRHALWKRAPKTSAPDEFDVALAELDQCIYGYIEAHRADDFAGCAILERLVRAGRDDGQPLTDRELRDQLFTLFFAGHETAATALCWIHYLLDRHPDVRNRLMREVDAVLGDSAPTAETLHKLEYTEQVVQECLRLYSPIHAISRTALVDHTLGGYRIPAGATVCVSLFATHRLPAHWPDPERFDPDRFTADQCAVRARFSYLPFAAGHRNCIGGGQAMVELKMIVAMIAQRYWLQIAAGQRIEPAPGTTMYPRYGMKMTLHPRPRA